jgi:1,2-diacylglycerol 3-beta-galactosyltransferase
MLFGGEGSPEMITIVKALDCGDPEIQLIALCGRNETIVSESRSMTRNTAVFVEGFTQAIAYYMELADFFIGKPGPGSISEAVAKKVPMTVQRNARSGLSFRRRSTNKSVPCSCGLCAQSDGMWR